MPERAAELVFGEGMMGETATCQVKRTGIILLAECASEKRASSAPRDTV
jgi:hypothetical protein